MAMPMMSGMGSGKMGAMEDEMGSAPDAAAEPMDDFTSAITEAFPDLAGDPARVEAMRTAIKLCLEKDEAGKYGDDEPAADMIAVFGEPKKKSK